MKLHPYLSFNGQCKTAFEFYEKCLGGQICGVMTYGESPMAAEAPPDWQDKVAHASLKIGDQEIMGADMVSGQYDVPQGFSVLLNVDSSEEAQRLFAALAEDGRVQMALEPTFWARQFGMVTDRFGTPWMVNCDLPV